MLSLLLWSGTSIAADSLDGAWTLKLDPGLSGDQEVLECEVTQDGRTLTVACGDEVTMGGSVDDARITFVMLTGENGLLQAKFSGTVNGDRTVIDGTWRLEDTGGNRIGRFRAQKHDVARR